MAALISEYPVQKSIAIHFQPWNLVLLAQNTCSILFLGIFVSIVFVCLVTFGNRGGH